MSSAILVVLIIVLTWLVGKLAGVALFASGWMVKLAFAAIIALIVLYFRSKRSA